MYEEETKSIPWLPLIGAFIGSIPGILLWALLGSFGITASLVGALIVGGAFLAYGIVCDLTGTPSDNVYGWIGCVIICLIAVYFGVHFAWAGMISNAMKEFDEEISVGKCAADLYTLLGQLEMRGKFVGAVFKGYLFSLIGAGAVFSKFSK